ncbi:MAG: OadG family protein [Lachnospiraceae bacterium]|nr:OadG family protein [Lachnospiraceae bacterium]
MKKKILGLLSVLLCMVMLAGCGETVEDYNGMTKDDLQQASQAMVSQLQQMGPDELKQAEEYYNQQVKSEEDPNAKMYAEMITDWNEIASDIGEFKEFGEFSVEKTGKTLTTIQVMKCSGRDARFVIVYNYLKMKPTAMNAEIIYTKGELMQRAGLNVVMGMGVVFVILILISLFIYAFNIFPYLENKRAEKKAGKAPEEKPAVEAAPAAAPAAAADDDGELIAVIAAAIAMQTGASTDSFVVRSIKRRF